MYDKLYSYIENTNHGSPKCCKSLRELLFLLNTKSTVNDEGRYWHFNTNIYNDFAVLLLFEKRSILFMLSTYYTSCCTRRLVDPIGTALNYRYHTKYKIS